MRALSFDGAIPGAARGFPAARSPSPHVVLCTSDSFKVEFCGHGDIQGALEPWRALAARALEPALCAEPGLVMPALQHFPGGRHVTLLLVWRTAANARTLRGVFPLTLPRLPMGVRTARLWHPGPEAGDAPLIDREDPEGTLGAALEGLRAHGARFGGLTLPGLAENGPIARALAGVAARSGRRLDRVASKRSFWTLSPVTPAGDPAPARHTPRSRAEAGRRVTLDQARAARDIRDAVEAFLVLDAIESNATGRAPLVRDPGVASFVRTVTRHFAHARRCRVDTLRIDGAPAAAAISFEGPEAVWLWRSASLPAANAHRDALLRIVTARARRGRKALEIRDETLVTEALAVELGLTRVALVDHSMTSRPGAAAVHWSRDLDRNMRLLARAGLHRLTGRATAA